MIQPVFDWVRLAQRVPVRIKITQVPDGVELIVGLTASVAIRRDCRASIAHGRFLERLGTTPDGRVGQWPDGERGARRHAAAAGAPSGTGCRGCRAGWTR